MLDATELRRVLNYDPKTGRFTWKERIGQRCVIGAEAGRVDGQGHKQITIFKRAYAAHRLAVLYMTGAFPEEEVDHVNRLRLDNRWANLRPATRVQNMRNRSKMINNTSGVTGVIWHTTINKFVARIQVNGVTHNLGCFDDIQDAAVARRAAEIEHFKDFARGE